MFCVKSNLEKGEKLQEDMERDYRVLQEKDKLLDRNFKKEFPGLGFHQMDALYKLYKKRPKVHSEFHRFNGLNLNQTFLLLNLNFFILIKKYI